MRLTVWGYSQGKYLYILGPSRLTLKYKTYSVVTQDNELEKEQKNILRKGIWQLESKKGKQKGVVFGAKGANSSASRYATRFVPSRKVIWRGS